MRSPLELEPRRRPVRFSVWTLLAPVALLACLSVIVVIAREAGWVTTPVDGRARTTRTPPAKHARGAAQPPATTPKRARARATYVIRAGDTLEAIALRFNTSVTRLLTVNPGIDPNALTVGRRLRVR